MYEFRNFYYLYINNVSIYSNTFKKHLIHFTKIFKKFKKLRIASLLKKSFIRYLFINLLGFKVNSLSLLNIKECVTVINKLEYPINLYNLERYLGYTVFLRKFILFYALKLAPLKRRKKALLLAKRDKDTVLMKINKTN